MQRGGLALVVLAGALWVPGCRNEEPPGLESASANVPPGPRLAPLAPLTGDRPRPGSASVPGVFGADAEMPDAATPIDRTVSPPTGRSVDVGGTERSVQAPLPGRLPRHQAHDGSVSCRSFSKHCRKNVCDGAGATDDHTVATTSLFLLAYLGAGHSMRHGKFKMEIVRAIKALLRQQQASGRIGAATARGVAPYNHALATWALCEAMRMSGRTNERPLIRMADTGAREAVRYLLAHQRTDGAWPNGVDPTVGDASLTCWSWYACMAAQDAGYTVASWVFQRADDWFDSVTDPDTGAVGYRRRGDVGPRPAGILWTGGTRSVTAAVAACRLLHGVAPEDPRILRVTDQLVADLPAWNPKRKTDFLYWMFGTHALYRVGGTPWATWQRALRDAVVTTQCRGGDEDGSWASIDAWGPQGGRAYATAVNFLTLETYYRCGKVLGARMKRGTRKRRRRRR